MTKSLETQKLINEKSIQRYIFEKLNYGNRKTLKELYPPSIYKQLGNKKILVIIPEYPIKFTKKENGVEKDFKHITDFRIVYSDGTYHNVEVEWKTSRFNSHTQIVYDECYKGGKGFIIVFHDDSLQKDKINYIEENSVIKISAADFSYWFALKAKRLVDETISNYVPKYISRDRKIWLIYLPSSGANEGNSKKDFLEIGKKKGKWAFRYSANKGNFMEKILDITNGDLVIFVWGMKTLNGTHQRQISMENDWYLEGIEIVDVSKGYYCDTDDDTFESKYWKINKEIEDKKYMHYFKFDKKPRYSSAGKTKRFFFKDSLSNINDRNSDLENIIKKIRWSLNNQGSPVDITFDEYNSLLMYVGVSNY